MSGVPGAARVAWVNGAVVAVGLPALPVGDRGFQLGDAVFETLRVRRGVAIEGAEHLARLREGLATLAIGGAPDDVDLLAAIATVVAANSLADAAVRVTISRGVPIDRGLLPAGWRDLRPNVVVQAWPHAAVEPGSEMSGVRAIVSVQRRDPAHPLAAIKTTSRADHVMAGLEAERAGVDDALVLTIDGRVGEASTANVAAVVVDGAGRPRLVTPGLDAGILAGATRAWLLGTDGAQAVGLPAGEIDLTVPDLLDAREAILCSSVAGIRALVELDGRPIGTGSPGPWARRLRDARETWIRAVAGG